jgi:hypothetical protein
MNHNNDFQEKRQKLAEICKKYNIAPDENVLNIKLMMS